MPFFPLPQLLFIFTFPDVYLYLWKVYLHISVFILCKGLLQFYVLTVLLKLYSLFVNIMVFPIDIIGRLLFNFVVFLVGV